jgi:tetratricopeptide (TPR) repeat protein
VIPDVLAGLAARGREFEALGRLVPALRPRLPRRLSDLYDFVPAQDLSAAAGRGPGLTGAEAARLGRALARLPERHPGTPMARAAAELASGRWAAALRRADAAGRAAPALSGRASLLAAAALWCRADRKRSRADIPGALSRVERAVAAGEDGREALLLRAQVRFEFEDNERGLEDLDALLARDPADRAARVGRAEILGDLHRCAEATAELDRLTEESRGAWWALAQRGRVHGMCGRPGDALADFSRALSRRPSGALLSWRGEVLRGVGRYAEARADLDAAVRRDPNYAFGWEIRGRLRLLAGDAAGARADCARAGALDPSLRMAALWRAEAALKLGRWAEAWEGFEASAPLDPATAWNPRSPEGRVPDRAARAAAFRADVAALPEGPWPDLLKGRFAVLGGDARGALAPLTRAARARPAAVRAGALAWRGQALLRLGGPAAAAKELAAARALLPSDGRFAAWEAEARLAAGQTAAARTLLEACLRVPDPCLAAAWCSRGRLRAEAGLWREALADFTMALVCDARHGPARAGRDEAEARAGSAA